MKKNHLLAILLLVAVIAGISALNYYRELQAQQRAQVAHLMASCANQGLLSLFALQANNWHSRPEFYQQQAQELDSATGQLPEKLLDGRPFSEWEIAVQLCGDLTRRTNAQHEKIFQPLGRFASREMTAIRTLKDREALARRQRTILHVQTGAELAGRYLDDLKTDIDNLLAGSGLSQQSREMVLREIAAQVMDHYRRGNFSLRQVNAHMERTDRYYRLLAENPRSFSLRSGSLYFHNQKLRREVENLNSAILQGEAEFYGNWRQILQYKQLVIR